jgi:uncharacterized protein YutE (UPF0331/DUF86 family)
MVDRDLVIAKASSVRKHLRRVEDKRGPDLETFIGDLDRQDIVSFNLHVAIQNCIDIAAHVISEGDMGVPGSITEMFYILQEQGYLSTELTEKMVKAVGFRNLLVHEYGKVDLAQVYEIADYHIEDLHEYLVCLLSKLEITQR